MVARASPGGALLGYFFGPRHEAIPNIDGMVALKPSSAVYVCRFGHLGLRSGKWPVTGPLPEWDRAQWPMPVFVRYEELSGRTHEVTYADDDPIELVAERVTTSSTMESLPLAQMRIVSLGSVHRLPRRADTPPDARRRNHS